MQPQPRRCVPGMRSNTPGGTRHRLLEHASLVMQRACADNLVGKPTTGSVIGISNGLCAGPRRRAGLDAFASFRALASRCPRDAASAVAESAVEPETAFRAAGQAGVVGQYTGTAAQADE